MPNLSIDVKDSEARQSLEDLEDYVESIAPVALSATENGTYTAPTGVFGYSPVVVDTGIYTGTTTPASTLGKDGDYYYQRTNTERGIKNHQDLYYSGQTTLGYEFIPKQDIMLTGLRGYVNESGVSFTVSIGTLSEILYTTESSISSVSGWNDVMLDEPIKLNANQHYVVMVSSSITGRYINTASTTISDFITAVGGRYGTYPGATDTDHLYFADIIFEIGAYLVDKQYIKRSGSWTQI